MCMSSPKISSPPPVEPPPAPVQQVTQTSKRAKNEVAKKAAQNFGASSTVATSPLGTPGGNFQSGTKTLLGQ